MKTNYFMLKIDSRKDQIVLDLVTSMLDYLNKEKNYCFLINVVGKNMQRKNRGIHKATPKKVLQPGNTRTKKRKIL